MSYAFWRVAAKLKDVFVDVSDASLRWQMVVHPQAVRTSEAGAGPDVEVLQSAFLSSLVWFKYDLGRISVKLSTSF